MIVRRRMHQVRLVTSVMMVFYLYQHFILAQRIIDHPQQDDDEPLLVRKNDSGAQHQHHLGFDSKVSKLSLGADLFENVCMVHSKQKTILHSSNERLYRQDILPLNDKHWRWTTQTATTKDWKEIVAHAVHIKEETLLVLNLFDNPGHCVNDLAFSMAMHHSHYIDNTKISTRTSLYRRFVYVHISKRTNGIFMDHARHFMASSCTEEDGTDEQEPGWSYCCQLMQSMGFIREQDIIAPPDKNQSKFCFRKLVVPRYAQHRIPSTQAQLNAIVRLRAHMFDTMKAQLNPAPWPSSTDSSSTTTPHVPTIFFQDRGDPRPTRLNATFVQNRPQRRMLQLSKIIQEKLEQQATVRVHRVRNFTQAYPTLLHHQAPLYNAQEYIVEVHGASLANLFFARPGTKVFEIQCAVPNSTANSNDWKWYSSVAPHLGLDYYQHLEHDGCLDNKQQLRDDYSPPLVKTNATVLVQHILHAFGLPRKSEDKKQR